MPENVIISEDYRNLTVPQDQLILGCVGDVWVRRVYFTAPRYCDGTDLSGYDFTVQFINKAGVSDLYEVEDLVTDTDSLTFSWLVSPIACANVGKTEVSVIASNVDDETGETLNRFLTTTYPWEVLPSTTAEGGELIEAQSYVEMRIAEWQAEIDEAISKTNYRSYDTVADMQADETLSVDMTAHTLGFHAAGDGGAAWYKIVATGTANGMDVLSCGNLFAVLKTDVANVMQYGAKPNDSNFDSTANVQKAIDSGKSVLFPAGAYTINSEINLYSFQNRSFDASEAEISYKGSNYAFNLRAVRNAFIKFGKISSSTGGCIYFDGTQNTYWSQYVDLSFQYLGAASTHNCIYADSENACWINEIRLQGGRFASGLNGLYLLHNSTNGISHWLLKEIGIEGVTNGFKLEVGAAASAASKYITDFAFYDMRTAEATSIFNVIGKAENFVYYDTRDPNFATMATLSSTCNNWKIYTATKSYIVSSGKLYTDVLDWCAYGVDLRDRSITDLQSADAMLPTKYVATNNNWITNTLQNCPVADTFVLYNIYENNWNTNYQYISRVLISGTSNELWLQFAYNTPSTNHNWVFNAWKLLAEAV